MVGGAGSHSATPHYITMVNNSRAPENTGFTEAYKRCCTGFCGSGDACADPSKHVIFDSAHPTDAAWKAITDLYTYSQGYTKGQTLAAWIQTNNL